MLTVTQGFFDDMLGFVVEVRGAAPPWLTRESAIAALRESGLVRNPKTFPWSEVEGKWLARLLFSAWVALLAAGADARVALSWPPWCPAGRHGS